MATFDPGKGQLAEFNSPDRLVDGSRFGMRAPEPAALGPAKFKRLLGTRPDST